MVAGTMNAALSFKSCLNSGMADTRSHCDMPEGSDALADCTAWPASLINNASFGRFLKTSPPSIGRLAKSTTVQQGKNAAQTWSARRELTTIENLRHASNFPCRRSDEAARQEPI